MPSSPVFRLVHAMLTRRLLETCFVSITIEAATLVTKSLSKLLLVSGARNDKGEHVPMSVAVGDQVLLPEYGGTKIEIESKEYTIFRESDIVAKFGKE